MPSAFDDDEFRMWNSTCCFLTILQWNEFISIPVDQKRWNSYLLPFEVIHGTDLCQIVLHARAPF